MIQIKNRLSQRIGINDIYELLFWAQGNDDRKQELYALLFDDNPKVAWQATWVFSHFSLHENKWLYDKQDELINEAMTCPHPGRRRLLLSLLYRQPIAEPLRVDFLDYCLERMMAKEELPSTQALCIKLAYEMCRPIPELLQELRTMLDIMNPAMLVPSTLSTKKNVLKAMKTGKTMQNHLPSDKERTPRQ